MSFATVSQVKDLVPKASTGSISDSQIQGFLDLNTADLTGAIKQRGYTVPSSGTFFDVLAGMNRDYAAFKLLYTLWNQSGKVGKNESADALKTDYNSRFEMLRNGVYDYLAEPTVSTPVNIASAVGAIGQKEPYIDYSDNF